MTEHLQTPSKGWTFLLGMAPLALLTILFGSLALLNRAAPETMQPVWETCRAMSQPVGFLGAIAFGYRLVMQAGEMARWQDPRAFHLLCWFTWIVGVQFLAALGARHYDQMNADATWISGARLVFHLGALVLCLWWPHPEKYEPLDGRAARA